MPKKRKTRKEKMVSSRRQEAQGFVIKEEWLSKTKAKKIELVTLSTENKFFKADLTKTGILTMLVLALELAIWNYLSRH